MAKITKVMLPQQYYQPEISQYSLFFDKLIVVLCDWICFKIYY